MPDRSIYVVGAISSFDEKEDMPLEKVMILGKTPDQLKYHYTPIAKDKAELKQLVGYAMIDSTDLYYQFMHDFFDEESLDKAELPKKLTDTFLAFDSYAQAKNEAEVLKDNQQKYYDSLIDADKPHARKLKIEVFDLIELLADFMRRKALPNAMNVKLDDEKDKDSKSTK